MHTTAMAEAMRMATLAMRQRKRAKGTAPVHAVGEECQWAHRWT